METKKEINIIPLNLDTITLSIKGVTPLLMDKMPEETLKAIQDKQTGIAKSGKKIRDIDKEIQLSVHTLPDGSVGFPAAGFKNALIECTSFVGDKMFSKKLVRGLKILNAENGLVPIKFKNQDILKHNIGANTKHTPQFHEWQTELTIRFDANNISASDIATLVDYSGFYYGIGIWSPRCKSGGSFGMYEVKKTTK